jgi:hypothetical protein
VKDKEKEKQQREHEAYVRACEDNNRKKQDQDNKWNQYYRDFDNKMSGKMKQYEEKYVLP